MIPKIYTTNVFIWNTRKKQKEKGIEPVVAEFIRKIVVCLALIVVWSGCQSLPKTATERPEQVVLLHGFGRSNKAMFSLQRRINEAGYATYNIEYRSMKDTPDVIVDKVGKNIAQCCMDNGRLVHFVGHSLGGLVVRAYLERHQLTNLGRVVLLGTPNQGSELVDRYEKEWFFGMLGPTARELGTDLADFPKRIAHPYYPLGIIAGASSYRPILSRLLPGPDDGMVAVESTIMEGMTDFLLVDTSHGMLRYNKKVAEEVIYFLRHGKFSHASADSLPWQLALNFRGKQLGDFFFQNGIVDGFDAVIGGTQSKGGLGRFNRGVSGEDNGLS